MFVLLFDMSQYKPCAGGNSLVKNDKEPLYGLPGINDEFTEYLDLVLMDGPTPDNLMFPSTANLVKDDKIVVFGYNGLPDVGTMEKIFNKCYTDSPVKPTVAYANRLFGLLGSKGASFGKVLATGPGIMSYDCSLLSGSSGSFIKKVEEPGVNFVGVHLGGDFNKADGVGYNYGYHTSHTAFVLLYAKYVFGIYIAKSIPIPEAILKYLHHHYYVLSAHREFIGVLLVTSILQQFEHLDLDLRYQGS